MMKPWRWKSTLNEEYYLYNKWLHQVYFVIDKKYKIIWYIFFALFLNVCLMRIWGTSKLSIHLVKQILFKKSKFFNTYIV